MWWRGRRIMAAVLRTGGIGIRRVGSVDKHNKKFLGILPKKPKELF